MTVAPTQHTICIYADMDWDTLFRVQLVHADDYYRLTAEVDQLGAKVRETGTGRRDLESAVRQKVAALEAVTQIGREMTRRNPKY